MFYVNPNIDTPPWPRLQCCISLDREAQSQQCFQEVFEAQMQGDYYRAVELYKDSLALKPTAEAQRT